MRRPTRAFKLKVSPAGFDLLVDCHGRLARVTRTLLPYGTTLYVGLHHVAAQSSAECRLDVTDFPAQGLAGSIALFVGAPRKLAILATGIARRYVQERPEAAMPELGQIYLWSLRRLSDAGEDDMVTAFQKTVQDHVGRKNIGEEILF